MRAPSILSLHEIAGVLSWEGDRIEVEDATTDGQLEVLPTVESLERWLDLSA
jgi:hypothetical protein